MKIKDFIFWSCFIAFWFVAGVLRSYLPPSRIQYVLGTPEKIRILATSDFLIPESFISALEKQTHTSIEIEEVTDWDDFLVRCIAQPGYHAIFAPRHWRAELEKQGLVQSWVGLRKFLNDRLDRDFSPPDAEAISFIPLIWTQSLFISNIEIGKAGVEKDIKNGNFRELRFLHDEDTIVARLNLWGLIKAKPNKDLLISTQSLGKELELSPLPFLAEVPHTYKNKLRLENSRLYEVKDSNSKSLLVYGLYLPKNTPDKASSNNLIREWLSDDLIYKFIESHQLASTLKASEHAKVFRSQQASYFRDLSFLGVYIPDQHQAYKFNELSEKLGIRSF